jgi:ribosomal protein L7/L12
MKEVFAFGGVVAALAAIAGQPKPRAVSEMPPPSADVKDLLRQGKKVAAVRACRKQTGATLLEAHHVIGRHAA